MSERALSRPKWFSLDPINTLFMSERIFSKFERAILRSERALSRSKWALPRYYRVLFMP